MQEENAKQTPKKDLMESALKHYEEAATAIHHWNSSIPDAIREYFSEKPQFRPTLPSLSDEEIEDYYRDEIGIDNEQNFLVVMKVARWMRDFFLNQSPVVGDGEKCDCVIPKPKDPYHELDKSICRDCNRIIDTPN